MAISKSQMSMLQRRRTTDIERLAQQYKKNVESLTGDYQKSFGEYQARTAEQMRPFEDQMAKYKTELYPEYEKQVQAYQAKLDSYKAALADIEANPLEVANVPTRRVGRGGAIFTIDGVEYGEGPLPDVYRLPGLPKNYSFQDGKLFRERAVPTFTEKAPELPQAPTLPQIGEFDASQFDQRRGQLETEFKREVGERKSARLSAVSRRSSRPLLQGS